MLFRNGDADLEACRVCGVSRYKRSVDDIDSDDVGEKRKDKRPPAKMVWYFPIISRLKRLFANKANAELMRWHAEGRKKDGMLRHPADGMQWRNFDTEYKEFKAEVRNIRFGLSTDGMNPFGNMSNSHSTWPVTLCIYNLPSWLCMKRTFLMMPLLISGPNQPGNDIDVYLQPLLDDLLVLWTDGVRVWDEYKREHFNLRAMLFVTIQDWPALANLSGKTLKGYNGCVWCLDETEGLWLKNCKKMVYMSHRRFLRPDHPYRRNKRAFDGTVETRRAPKLHTGKHVYKMVKNLRVVLGKGKGSTKFTAGKLAPMFKKRSIFWNLPYWKHLMVRHAIDVMHVEKNVFDSLIGTLLDIPGKTKDTLNARLDLEDMKLRKILHPKILGNGANELPTACYTLSKQEKMSLCSCLHGIKVPTGYSSNVKRLVNMKTLKLVGMKSHDCHMMMIQLLVVAIRGILPDKVRDPIIKLCSFFNAISQKVIDPTKLTKLQEDVVHTMCQLESIFPPSFFDIMPHLIVHIVHEIKYLGPVFLHQMYPFERFMSVLKKYVRNRGRPEGCMAQGWGTEEVVEFAVNYMDLKAIGKPVSRHEGRLKGKGTLGHNTVRSDNYVSFTQAHFAVLQQADVVADTYVPAHVQMLRSTNPTRSDDWIARAHRDNFGSWLRRHMMDKDTDDALLEMLANGPSTTIHTYKAYDINGYTFYTRAQDNKSTNQNSGVRIDAYDRGGNRETYYGFIVEIWELEYGEQLKVPLFRCQWVSLPDGVNTDKYGMTTVNLKRIGYREQPFVLANDVTQVFYVKDMDPVNKEERHVVLQAKRKIVGVEDVVDEEDYNKFDDLPPFGENVDLPLIDDTEEPTYIRRDHNEAIIVK